MYKRQFSLFAIMLIAVAFFMGCAAVKSDIDAYQACRNDVECMSKMAQVRSTTAAIVAPVEASGVPGGWITVVVSNLATVISGVVLGRKLKRKG